MVLNTMYCIRKKKQLNLIMVLKRMYCIRKKKQLNLWY